MPWATWATILQPWRCRWCCTLKLTMEQLAWRPKQNYGDFGPVDMYTRRALKQAKVICRAGRAAKIGQSSTECARARHREHGNMKTRRQSQPPLAFVCLVPSQASDSAWPLLLDGPNPKQHDIVNVTDLVLTMLHALNHEGVHAQS